MLLKGNGTGITPDVLLLETNTNYLKSHLFILRPRTREMGVDKAG